MDEWIVVEPKDQERIWDVAMALLAQGEGVGGPPSLEVALQRAATEYFAASNALRRGVRFYMLVGGEQEMRQIRVLENGTWVQERVKQR